MSPNKQIPASMTQQTRERISFAAFPDKTEPPDLLAVQIQAYEDFLQLDVPSDKRKSIGLEQAFTTNFPITDAREIYELEYIDYYIERPKYSETECRERELSEFIVPANTECHSGVQ